MAIINRLWMYRLKKIEAIVFDCFGVIVTDQYDTWLKKNNLSREGMFSKLSQDADLDLISMDEFFDSLSELSGIPRNDILTDFKDNTVLNQEVIKLIKELRQSGFKLGLLSNSSGGWLRHILAQHNLEPLFDEIVISAEAGMVKPDPEIFELMLEKLGVLAKAAIFIDDRNENVEAAKRVGMEGVVFEDPASLRGELL